MRKPGPAPRRASRIINRYRYLDRVTTCVTALFQLELPKSLMWRCWRYSFGGRGSWPCGTLGWPCRWPSRAARWMANRWRVAKSTAQLGSARPVVYEQPTSLPDFGRERKLELLEAEQQERGRGDDGHGLVVGSRERDAARRVASFERRGVFEERILVRRAEVQSPQRAGPRGAEDTSASVCIESAETASSTTAGKKTAPGCRCCCCRCCRAGVAMPTRPARLRTLQLGSGALSRRWTTARGGAGGCRRTRRRPWSSHAVPARLHTPRRARPRARGKGVASMEMATHGSPRRASKSAVVSTSPPLEFPLGKKSSRRRGDVTETRRDAAVELVSRSSSASRTETRLSATWSKAHTSCRQHVFATRDAQPAPDDHRRGVRRVFSECQVAATLRASSSSAGASRDASSSTYACPASGSHSNTRSGRATRMRGSSSHDRSYESAVAHGCASSKALSDSQPLFIYLKGLRPSTRSQW